jgi:spore coat polysaccharide biosynthesis protein SpsF
MTSTRLPGKVLLPILGKPMLELLVERLKMARSLSGIVIATTENAPDDAIERLARQLGVGCYRGSEDDVLDRVLRAAQTAGAEIVVEITGDNPLVDPGVLDQVVSVFLQGNFHYVSNCLKRTYPLGLGVQVFPVAVLAEVALLTQDPADREHVSLYIYEHPERFSLFNVESGLLDNHSLLRLTVDTQEDFHLIKTIFEELYPENPRFTLADVLELLDRRPDLRDFNRHICQKRVR